MFLKKYNALLNYRECLPIYYMITVIQYFWRPNHFIRSFVATAPQDDIGI